MPLTLGHTLYNGAEKGKLHQAQSETSEWPSPHAEEASALHKPQLPHIQLHPCQSPWVTQWVSQLYSNVHQDEHCDGSQKQGSNPVQTYLISRQVFLKMVSLLG